MSERSRGWIRAAVAVVILLVVAMVAAPFLVPADAIRDRVIVAVRDATGRDLAIKGGVSVSVIPVLAVSAKDVTLSNAPWAGSQPMASLAALQLRLKLLPLLSRQVEIASFVIEDPVIDLRTDRQGRGNWQFGNASPNPPAASPDNAAEPGRIPELSLGDVRIVNGRVAYTDGVTGQTQTVDQINLKASLANLDAPLKLEGSAHWRDRKTDLSLAADQARGLLLGGSPVALSLTSDLLRLAFKGNIGGSAGTGQLDLAIPSLRNLAAWIGTAPADLPPEGLGAATLKSNLALSGKRLACSDLQLSLDATKAVGQLTVDASGPRPALRGQLAFDRLDLSPYLPAGSSGGKAAPSDHGWSDRPIDVSALKAADLDVGLSANSIVARKLETGKTALKIQLTDGRLAIELAEMALYQGNLNGRLALDGSGPILGAEANITLSQLQAEPLLQALAGVDVLTGAAAGETSLASRGRSQQELVQGLDGKGRLAFTNGVIKGVDLGALIRNVAQGLSGAASGDKTEFTQLSGSYTISRGILKNTDLALLAPLFRLAGAGNADLPHRSLDYRLVPELAATAQGQGGAKNVAGLSVPVLVRGPWDNLTYTPDLAAMAKGRVGGEAGALLDALGGKGSPQQAQVPNADKPARGLPFPLPLPGLPGLGR